MREIIDMLTAEEEKIRRRVNECRELYRNAKSECEKHMIQRDIDLKQGKLNGVILAKDKVIQLRQFIKTGRR